MLRKIYFSISLILACSTFAYSQSGTLKGKIANKENSESVPFANIIVELNGVQVAGTTTDFDGNYVIKPIPPGKYTIKASYIGFTPVEIHGVIISADRIEYRDIKMSSTSVQLGAVEVFTLAGPPLIQKDNTSTGDTKTREDIKTAPTRDVKSIAATTAGIFQKDEGGDLNVKGARTDATFYYIDGIKVRGSTNLPNQGIEQVSIITGGVPAQYGDVTGGIINITTRGPSRNYFGGVEYVTSELFDQYGYNLLGLNLSGPIKSSYDSTLKIYKPLAGFFLAGEIQSEKDPDPSAIGMWKVKDEKLKSLEESPLRPSATGVGFVRNAEFIRLDDLEKIKAKQNVAARSYRLSGKIDLQPSANTGLTFGGSYDKVNKHDYIYVYTLFNTDNNSQTIEDTWRVFGRFTQKFSAKTSAAEAKSASALKNAYYSVQVDYSRFKRIIQDDTHKDEFFNYGYLGKFTTHKANSYEYKFDTVRVNGVLDTLAGWFHSGFSDTSYTFERSELNPVAANYTSQFYSLYGRNPRTANEMRNNGGLQNGDNPTNVYSLWRTVGRQYPQYRKDDETQFRVTVQGSADILSNHAITVGMEYEQRDDRRYIINPVGLWGLMRQLANQKNAQLDLSNPILMYQGDVFLEGDTVVYNRQYSSSDGIGFFENSRAKLGIANTDFLDVDSYLPSDFSMDMFTADELLNAGNSYISYYGFDYLGNKQKSKPTFDDFFTKKDEKGNFTRGVPSFQPIYMSGYIQDKFDLRDLVFRIGVRVDRFDANQMVLKDPYVFYETNKKSDVPETLNPNGSHPANIGDDYVVYVNDLLNPSAVVGYRKDDKWFNAEGTEVNDPNVLAKATTTGKITPYLIDPNNKDITSSAFKDYDPQTNFMPRISFSFPISDEAQFFANYDVLTQRPPERLRLNPINYIFIQNTVGDIINNPNLKPQKSTDYELGFRQKVGIASALTLSAFYSEKRDMIQIVAVNFAYPANYTTFGNIDFGTVKGFSVAYDLRRFTNARLTANYTLQFADGTGSSATTGQSLINAGQPNLRIPMPLDFDQRHAITTSFDYRYGSGKGDDKYDGPRIAGKNIFASTGANFVVRAGSGVPYTRQSNVTQGNANTGNVAIGLSQRSTLLGSINGSRLPWSFRIDTKVDRDIELKWGSKGEGKKVAYLNVYIQVQNLLDKKNIIEVYPATGNPDDDGYLTDAASQALVQGQIDPQSFIDLYTLKVNNPDHYSLPRRMRLGISLNF